MLKILLWAVALYFLMCLLFYFFQHLVLFQKQSLPNDFRFFLADREIEEVWLGDQNQYHAVMIKSKSAKGVIIYFHGNRGNVSRWITLTSALQERYDYDLLLVDFPGFGKSTASIKEKHFFEVATMAIQHALGKYDLQNIVLFGRSMGSGLASWLATHYSVKALILETPYDTLQNLVGRFAFFLPYKQLLRYNFEPYYYLPKVKSPIFILHGTDDGLIPVNMAQRLSVVVPDQTTYAEIENGKHDNLAEYAAYWDTLDLILQ